MKLTGYIEEDDSLVPFEIQLDENGGWDCLLIRGEITEGDHVTSWEEMFAEYGDNYYPTKNDYKDDNTFSLKAWRENMKGKKERIQLYFQDSHSDKVYNIVLSKTTLGWYVESEYGRRGATLTKQEKANGQMYHNAKIVYDELVAEKKKKGYTEQKPIDTVKPIKVNRIYGASDDLIEIECVGLRGEYGCYGTDNAEQGILLVCSDGTLLEVKYGKNDEAIWEVKLIKKGELFERIDSCDDSEAEIYSDIAYFKEGLKWVYAAKEWEKVS